MNKLSGANKVTILFKLALEIILFVKAIYKVKCNFIGPHFISSI